VTEDFAVHHAVYKCAQAFLTDKAACLYRFTPYRWWDKTAFWILTSMRASCLLYTPSWIFCYAVRDVHSIILCVCVCVSGCNPSNWPLYTAYWPPASSLQPPTHNLTLQVLQPTTIILMVTQHSRQEICAVDTPTWEIYSACVPKLRQARNVKQAIYGGATNQPVSKLDSSILTGINPSNAELNHICHLLELLGDHHIFHVSGLRVNAVKIRWKEN